MRIINLVMLFLLFCTIMVKAQVSILTSNITSFNVTPQSLTKLNVMNYHQTDLQVVLEAKLLNSAGEPLLTVHSAPFMLKSGMNISTNLSVQLQTVQYGASPQANYLQTHNKLSSGKFTYCAIIKPISGAEASDDYCEDIEGDVTSFLYLVEPYDKDTVVAPRPVFIWAHSEPFNILGPGEYFKIVAVKLSEDQDAEAGITANIPVYQKSYLTTHQIPYPIDAPELKAGERYGWQIQKIANEAIIDKSEAWEFIVAPEKEIKEHQYAVLKKKMDGGYYQVYNDRLYFQFSEDYSGERFHCKIYNSKQEEVQPVVSNELTGASGNFVLKKTGDNRFEINMVEVGIDKGYYILETQNEKGESFLLRFYVP